MFNQKLNGNLIVVVTDHNTTKGIKKLQTAVSIITRTYPTYNIHPHILHGVEISAADKLHIVCIYDHEKNLGLINGYVKIL